MHPKIGFLGSGLLTPLQWKIRPPKAIANGDKGIGKLFYHLEYFGFIVAAWGIGH